MGLIMKNGISYGGGSGTAADTSHIELTFAEYKELENQGKVDDDTIYFITDEDINGNNNVDNLVELTQAEYNELGDVVNSDNKTYYITDSEEELDASMITFDDTETQLGVNNVQGAISKLNTNLDGKYGNDFLQFPNTWTQCGIEGQALGSISIQPKSDNAITVNFRNKYLYPPMVTPIVYSTSGTWCYLTSMVSNITESSCNLNFHNLEDRTIEIKIGYLAIG